MFQPVFTSAWSVLSIECWCEALSVMWNCPKYMFIMYKWCCVIKIQVVWGKVHVSVTWVPPSLWARCSAMERWVHSFDNGRKDGDHKAVARCHGYEGFVHYKLMIDWGCCCIIHDQCNINGKAENMGYLHRVDPTQAGKALAVAMHRNCNLNLVCCVHEGKAFLHHIMMDDMCVSSFISACVEETITPMEILTGH
jgi:hypothetical protein